MSSTPIFAVVGHPNKGKSSLVATLAQDDSVLISPRSGTTTANQSYPLRVDGKVLYELIDTPGFQRARATYEWLHANSLSVSDRVTSLGRFIDTHQHDPKFSAETQLLTPILSGAGIIYVVDGSRPYGEEYEIEMEILRWSGQPSMALINLIGPADYVEEWRTVLNQYFKIVRVFNPLSASFSDRIQLLRGFAQLDDAWADSLEQAIEGLTTQRAALKRQSAIRIADLMQSALTHSESKRLDADQPDQDEHAKQALQQRFQHALAKFEQQAHTTVESLYQHHNFSIQEDQSPTIIEADLFSKASWTLFGLDQAQLIATSVTGGALAGGVIDLAVGGHSFFLGAGLGAAAAGITTWFATDQLGKFEVLGSPLGGKELSLGPVKNRNFPYILLSRALLHHHIVESHSHADQTQRDISLSEALLKNLDLKQRLPFEKLFSHLRKGRALNADQQEKLISLIEERLVHDNTPKQ